MSANMGKWTMTSLHSPYIQVGPDAILFRENHPLKSTMVYILIYSHYSSTVTQDLDMDHSLKTATDTNGPILLRSYELYRYK